jgi:hypothetical protein
MGLKETITSARDFELLAVEVPEWGTTVHLKQLSVAERLALVDQIDGSPDGKLGVLALLHTLCEADGKLVFDPKTDYDLVAAKSARVVDRLSKLSSQLNKMQPGAVEAAKKNNETDPS